jgi:plasmid stabilization system protein ParE
MIYEVEISSVAEAEADQAFLWWSQVASLEEAKRWYAGLLAAIDSLSQMPKRCAIAKENE